jgi:transposase
VWVEALPAYAPDLNPVEWAWQHLKHVGLRHVTCLDLEELQMQLHLAIGRLRQKADIVRPFFAGAGLSV